ncbi:hypothetical protein C8R44DRAFT_730279 [Mycena epipterygia]|nr:hypothetical protein C8R44DRAFT_730279 [Mycena epipterygia]
MPPVHLSSLLLLPTVCRAWLPSNITNTAAVYSNLPYGAQRLMADDGAQNGRVLKDCHIFGKEGFPDSEQRLLNEEEDDVIPGAGGQPFRDATGRVDGAAKVDVSWTLGRYADPSPTLWPSNYPAGDTLPGFHQFGVDAYCSLADFARSKLKVMMSKLSMRQDYVPSPRCLRESSPSSGPGSILSYLPCLHHKFSGLLWFSPDKLLGLPARASESSEARGMVRAHLYMFDETLMGIRRPFLLSSTSLAKFRPRQAYPPSTLKFSSSHKPSTIPQDTLLRSRCLAANSSSPTCVFLKPSQALPFIGYQIPQAVSQMLSPSSGFKPAMSLHRNFAVFCSSTLVPFKVPAFGDGVIEVVGFASSIGLEKVTRILRTAAAVVHTVRWAHYSVI